MARDFCERTAMHFQVRQGRRRVGGEYPGTVGGALVHIPVHLRPEVSHGLLNGGSVDVIGTFKAAVTVPVGHDVNLFVRWTVRGVTAHGGCVIDYGGVGTSHLPQESVCLDCNVSLSVHGVEHLSGTGIGVVHLRQFLVRLHEEGHIKGPFLGYGHIGGIRCGGHR